MDDPNNKASDEKAMPSALDVISELQRRLSAIEAEHAALKKMVNDARDRGDVGFDFEHAQHVLTKHFHHDRPSANEEAAEQAKPKFDPYTGERLAA